MKVFFLKGGTHRIVFAGDVVISDGHPGVTTFVQAFGVGYEVEGSFEDVLLDLVGGEIEQDPESETKAPTDDTARALLEGQAIARSVGDPTPESHPVDDGQSGTGRAS